MKIIAVGMNYATHNQEMKHTEANADPVIFLKPDSALLTGGKPFFVPDFLGAIHYETEVVVRISRLGRHIAPRFAHRYYDAVTVGIDFTARELQSRLRAEGKPWELSKGFDGSAAIGTFVPLAEAGGDVQALDFHLDIDGREVQHGNSADMLFTVDRIIAYVSRFMTLKMGDLLFTGTPAGVGAVAPEQHLQGYLGETKVLDFYCK
ncbi:MAG: fumarylacetoacetate hydrolase family protein [Mediterranea sp.]|jgi:2-keto-4-pentenoate hydratase/2-oxohepta-3-ene-1,7-dioic acid hydratase in catechol pathway|nr:fumarylacetoacetate hydrolase family protein [Mediterranea sp.]